MREESVLNILVTKSGYIVGVASKRNGRGGGMALFVIGHHSISVHRAKWSCMSYSQRVIFRASGPCLYRQPSLLPTLRPDFPDSMQM